MLFISSGFLANNGGRVHRPPRTRPYTSFHSSTLWRKSRFCFFLCYLPSLRGIGLSGGAPQGTLDGISRLALQEYHDRPRINVSPHLRLSPLLSRLWFNGLE